MSALLSALTQSLSQILRHSEIQDYSGAQNGLHLENSGTIRRLAAAVDANILTLQAAAAEPSTLLIVHHGLAWNGLCPLTDGKYRMMKHALDADLAVYSSHLPLDAHPTLGNNILLTRRLEFSDSIPFLDVKGTLISRLVKAKLHRNELRLKVEATLGSTQLIPGGPEETKNILISTGSGNSLLKECADYGIDTIITGEVSHDVFSQAHEQGINLILGGHYATETLGVKALTEQLAQKYDLPWTFIDKPSGL